MRFPAVQVEWRITLAFILAELWKIHLLTPARQGANTYRTGHTSNFVIPHLILFLLPANHRQKKKIKSFETTDFTHSSSCPTGRVRTVQTNQERPSAQAGINLLLVYQLPLLEGKGSVMQLRWSQRLMRVCLCAIGHG